MTTPPARRAVELPAVVPREAGRGGGRGLLTLLLLAALAWSLAQVEWRDGLLRTGGLAVLRDLAGGLVRPDVEAATLARALDAAWRTVVYAVAGMTVAIALGLPLGIVASGTLARTARGRRASRVAGEGVLSAMRAVHELVWAWLFVVAIGLSPFAAVLAIGIPYAGILGRIAADLLIDVPAAPLAALRAAGAGEAKTLLYGRAPMALPDLIAYGFYRFECALRASAIMGFVGLGGLGFEIQAALSDLDFRAVGTFLLTLVVLITAVEAWSSVVRHELVR
ncbi:MAG: PhnE/PtxC family ABC transporter permease [Dehalococcoidia bacterium]